LRFGTAQFSIVDMDATTIHERRWIILGVLCFSLLLVGIDNTILNVALPRLAEDLDASTSALQWIVDSYVLVFAGLLLTAGALGDRFGRRRSMVGGLVVFGVGSALSAFSTTAGQLIGTRALMGLGGAFIMPSTLSILTNVFADATERARAIAIWAGFAGLGIAIGPITGGWLLEHFWWGSVFLINVPVVAAAVIFAVVVVPESSDPARPKIDLLGAGLSIVGLVALVWSLIEAPGHGWLSTPTLGGLGVAVAAIGAFIWWERRVAQPMLDIDFFRRPRFSAGCAGITITYFALFGSMFLVTQLFQFVLGYSPLHAGFAMMPIAFTVMIVAPASARVVERLGTKKVVTSGMVLAALGLLLLSRVTETTSYPIIGLDLVLLSLGMGLIMPPATEAVMGALPANKAGVGSAVNDTTREVGGALGIAMFGSITASAYSQGVGEALAGVKVPDAAAQAIEHSVGGAMVVADEVGGSSGAALARIAQESFIDGYGTSLAIAAVIVFLGAIAIALSLPARAMDEAPVDDGEADGIGDLSIADAPA
jgi:EmrB/QacA subfamily drug resistance transporter